MVSKEYNHKIPRIGRGCMPADTNNIPEFIINFFSLIGYLDWKSCGYDLAGESLKFLLTNLKHNKIEKLNPPDE